jgi:hypothetical protein
MNVDFCNSKAYLIDSKDLKEKVYVECESLFGCSLRRDNFPGPQPVTIEKKNLPLKEKYMVCEKSDGERGLLLLLQINTKSMCFMLNRKNELYFMDFSFKKEVFEGSVFDGEMIQTKGENPVWHFLIHDCFVYNGTSFINKPHNLRYACGIDFIVKRYNPREETDPFLIKTKIFYEYGPEITKTWDHIQKTSEHKIDGLILTPVDNPVLFTRDNTLFKWKETHTIDFFAKIVGKKMNLYYYKKVLSVYVSFKKESKNYTAIVDFVGENVDLLKGAVIEFKILDDYYEPYRLRKDKNRPNGEITVNNTFKNIQESIKISELYLKE